MRFLFPCHGNADPRLWIIFRGQNYNTKARFKVSISFTLEERAFWKISDLISSHLLQTMLIKFLVNLGVKLFSFSYQVTEVLEKFSSQPEIARKALLTG